MKINKKTVIIAGAAVAVIGVAAVLLFPEKVDKYEVTEGEAKSVISGTGTIEADDVVTVYATESGKILNMMIEVGDNVSAGDVIADYDMDDFERAYEMAQINTDYYQDGYDSAVYEDNKAQARYEAAVASANANKQKYYDILAQVNELNSKSRDVNVETAQELQVLTQEATNYEEDIVRYGTELTELYVEKAEYESEMSQYSTEKDFAELASESGVISSSSIADISANYDEAKANRDATNTRIDAKKKKIDNVYDDMQDVSDQIASLPVDGMTDEEYELYLALQTELDRTNREWTENLSDKSRYDEHIINDSTLSQYEDSVELAKIELDKAEEDMDTAREGIVAEVDGVVMELYADAGAAVAEGQPVCVIQPTSGYKTTIMISKYDITDVKVGQSASVRLGNYEYAATVSRINDVAEYDASGKAKVKVELELEVAEGAAVPTIGLEADVKISTNYEADALVVPKEAVYTDDDGDFVYLVEDGKVTKRYITVKFKGTDVVAVEDGLEAGEKVITTVMTDENIGDRVI